MHSLIVIEVGNADQRSANFFGKHYAIWGMQNNIEATFAKLDFKCYPYPTPLQRIISLAKYKKYHFTVALISVSRA